MPSERIQRTSAGVLQAQEKPKNLNREDKKKFWLGVPDTGGKPQL